MPLSCLGRLATFAMLSCAFAAAQQDQPSTETAPTCNPWKLQVLPEDLSFRQRSCLQIAQLASPGLLLRAGAMAGYAHWRNASSANPKDSAEFSRRIANYYARRTARAGAELMVGYLHHEDPRLRSSAEKGAWRRTRAAFLSVIESPDQDGNARPAFAPIAGAFGSGFTSMAVDLHRNNVDDALRHSGLVYSHYFVTALVHEFSPELWSLTPHFIRKHSSKP